MILRDDMLCQIQFENYIAEISDLFLSNESFESLFHIPGSFKCVKFVPFHPTKAYQKDPKGRNSTYLEDPGIFTRSSFMTWDFPVCFEETFETWSLRN